MHIPDGFIPLDQSLVYALIALPFIIRAFLWARREMNESMLPIFAVLAAGVFAIQAINIPIPWGTSGHMVGGVLVAILLGSPWAGVLVLTLVVGIQGFFFADGGLTVMAANILNMGIISTFAGYGIYAALRRFAQPTIAGFVGAWFGLVISAVIVAVELAVAGTFPLIEGIALMALYHLVIGAVAEGAITAVVIRASASSAPDLFPALQEASQ